VEDTAKWICDCGQEIPQPAGEVPIIQACVHCGASLKKIREIDGTITHFEKASDAYSEEFNKIMQESQAREMNLGAAQADYFKLMYEIIPALIQKVKNHRNKQKVLLERGIKKGKLDNSLGWGYNPMMRCFVGRERKKEVLGDV